MLPISDWWNDTLHKSIAYSLPSKIVSSISKAFPSSLSKVGTYFQLGGYLLGVVILFAVIGLPRFAEDKYGLAAISLGGLVLWLAGWFLHGKEQRRSDPLDLWVVAFLGINVVATFSSHYLVESIKGLGKEIVYIGSYFLFAFTLSGSVKKKYIALAVIILSGFVLSAYGLYQYKIGVEPLATWEDPNALDKTTRIYSTLGNPNLLAGFLVPIAPMALAFSLSSIACRQWLFAVGGLGSCAVISAATILTGSRGGIAAIAVSIAMILLMCGAWVWTNHKKHRPLVIGGLVGAIGLAIVAVFVVPGLRSRIESMTNFYEHSSNAYRMKVYESSLHMFLDNWWIGVGIGNDAFRRAYGLYMVSGYDALGTYCVPLEVGVEAGLVALLVFAAIIAVAMSRAHIRFWLSDGTSSWSYARWIYAGVAAALAGLMVHGLVDTVFYRPQVHFLFWFLLALVVASDSPQPEKPDGRPDMA
jgi:Lipid A core - O-antigen ligase and related enzymes